MSLSLPPSFHRLLNFFYKQSRPWWVFFFFFCASLRQEVLPFDEGDGRGKTKIIKILKGDLLALFNLGPSKIFSPHFRWSGGGCVGRGRRGGRDRRRGEREASLGGEGRGSLADRNLGQILPAATKPGPFGNKIANVI